MALYKWLYFFDFFRRLLCAEFQLRENKLVGTLGENIKYKTSTVASSQ